MSLSNELLKKNWPAISQAIGDVGSSERKKAKDLYFNGKARLGNAILRSKEYPGVDAKLLVMHSISDDVIDSLSVFKEWNHGNVNAKNQALYLAKKILGRSRSTLYAFCDNTLYHGKERALIEALGYVSENRLGELTDSLRSKSTPQAQQRLLALPGSLTHYLRQNRPAECNQATLDIAVYEATLKAVDPSLINAGYKDNDWLAVEWATRHSDLLDKSVAELSIHLRDLLVSNRIPVCVNELYQRMIDTHFDDYVSEHQLGERTTVAIQYEKESQLESTIRLLDPVSRYPMEPQKTEGLIRYLPETAYEDYRVSNHILWGLWHCSQTFEGYQKLEDNKLVFYPSMTSRYSTEGYSGLGFDTSDIERKRQGITDDLQYNDAQYYPHCVVVGDDRETYQLGLFNYKHRLHLQSNAKLRSFAGSFSTAEELALKMATIEGNRILSSCYSD